MVVGRGGGGERRRRRVCALRIMTRTSPRDTCENRVHILLLWLLLFALNITECTLLLWAESKKKKKGPPAGTVRDLLCRALSDSHGPGPYGKVCWKIHRVIVTIFFLGISLFFHPRRRFSACPVQTESLQPPKGGKTINIIDPRVYTFRGLGNAK